MIIQQTLIILKPDCLQRGLVGEVTSRLERKGLKLVGVKMMRFSDAILEEHYSHLKEKPFFPKIKNFMQSSPCIVMVWQGIQAVSAVRKIAGITKAYEAEPGSIRGDLALSQQYNIIHASDSLETAKEEIDRVFSPEELYSYEKVDINFIIAEDERQKADDAITI